MANTGIGSATNSDHSTGSGHATRLTARIQRVLTEMAQEAAFARWDASAKPPLWRVVSQKQGISLARAAFDKAMADDLISAGSLCSVRHRGGPRLVITEPGRAALARALAPPDIEAFQAQHALLQKAVVEHETGAQPVTINGAESPMLWLHRRRDAAGQPLINAAQFAAGERFRADLTFAGALPQVTANWSPVARNTRGDSPPLAFSETRLAARQRLDRAMAQLDSEMTGVMIDICGFLKSLGQIEQERGWSRRTARHVLGRALLRLAEHYGLSPQAARPRPEMRHWGAPNYRPVLRVPG